MTPAKTKRRTKLLSYLAIGSAALGAAAIATAAQSRAAAKKWPILGQMIEVDGVALQVLERGEGTPLVLIHGNGAMIEDWLASGLFDALAENYRVIAFDRPGCGHSERPRGGDWSAEGQAALLVAACRQLGIERPVVLGHSWGTLVAVAWALDHPADVSALVLASGYYYPTPAVDAVLAAAPAIPGIGDAMRHTISPLVGRALAPLVFRHIFAPRPVPDRFKTGYPTGLSLRPLQLRSTAVESISMIAAAARMAPRFAELTLPIAVIAGDADKLISYDTHSKRLADELPQAWLITAAGAGHMVHYQAPDRVIEAVDLAAGGA